MNLRTVNRLTRHMIPMMCEEYDPLRGSGRTTVRALQTIQNCITNPGVWMSCYDHTGIKAMDREVRRVVQQMVEQLGLQFFEFRESSVRSMHMIKESVE